MTPDSPHLEKGTSGILRAAEGLGNTEPLRVSLFPDIRHKTP